MTTSIFEINLFDKSQGFFSSSNFKNKSINVFGKWQPSEENIKKALILSYLGSTALWWLSPKAPENELITRANSITVVGLWMLSLIKKDRRWISVALTVNNLLGLVAQTVNPFQLVFSTLVGEAFRPIYQDLAATITKESKSEGSNKEETAEVTITRMKNILDEKVIGQDQAKQIITQALFFHQQFGKKDNEIKIPKGNVLLTGPSGSGKTYLVETVCRALNIPMASMDISRATREGYVGPKISDVFQSLLDAANGDVEKASRGVIFFDEIDKVFEDSIREAHGANSITGQVIQNQLLCLLQGDSITIPKNRYESISLKTDNILFIFAGAFHDKTVDNILNSEQLIACGIRPEFLGRIGYISQLSPLTREQIKQILTHGPNAVLTAWKNQFEKFNFKLVVNEATVEEIVTQAMERKTGARGLHFEVRSRLSNLLASLILQHENSDKASSDELQIIEI